MVKNERERKKGQENSLKLKGILKYRHHRRRRRYHRPHLKTLDILRTKRSLGDFLPPQLPSEEALPFRCW